MMGISTFGMVTILLLTLVSIQANPSKIWSSNTVPPWDTWQPANHVTTFKAGGVAVRKFKDGLFTNIDPPLNGQIINPTTIPNSYLLLRNNGNLDQTADGRTSPIYTSNTARKVGNK
jgi:hypothetical protein